MSFKFGICLRLCVFVLILYGFEVVFDFGICRKKRVEVV
jgi:hypothetical protein